jgi:uncharacterized membrane protein YhaH (DUF805 family)
VSDENLLQSARRTQMIIWLAFTTEPCVYVIVALVLSLERTEPAGQEVSPYLLWGFYLLAVILALASLLVRRFLLSDRQLKARFEAGRLESDESPPLEGLSAREARLLSLAQWYLVAMLVGWGLNSCIPVGGLVLLLQGSSGATLSVLSAAAVALNLLAYPRLDAVIERARSVTWGG